MKEEAQRKIKRERALSRPKMESSPIKPGFDDDVFGFDLQNARAKEDAERLLREEAQYVDPVKILHLTFTGDCKKGWRDKI